MFSLSGKVFKRFRSYLEQLSQRMSVHDILSDVQFLLSGVPQGSVFGSLIFTMYTRPLGIIAQRYGVKYHLYTDDRQLYISLNHELNFSSSLKYLEHCIAAFRLLMTQNLLKLNDNKTNITYLASPHCAKSIKTPTLQMGASLITRLSLTQEVLVNSFYAFITSRIDHCNSPLYCISDYDICSLQ